MFKRTITFFSFAILALFIVTGVNTAIAQQQPQAQASAQIDVSDKEITTFVEAAKEVQKLQGKSEQEMMGIIKDEGLKTNRYVEIVKMDKDSSKNVEEELSKDEFEKYNNAKTKIDKITKSMEEKQVEAIEGEGIKVERYIEIAQAARQNPELSKKIRAKLQTQGSE